MTGESPLARFTGRLFGKSQEWIEAEALKARLDEGETLTMVDVRGAEEFVGDLGHIPNSCNIPLDDLAQRIEELQNLRERTIVFVCLTDKRSSRAAQELKERGFRDVPVLRGGMQRWNELGFDTSHQP